MSNQVLKDYLFSGYVMDGYVQDGVPVSSPYPIILDHPNGQVNISSYFENQGGTYGAAQPDGRSAADIRFGFSSRMKNDIISCSLGRLTKAEADALRIFFNSTVNGMQQSFTLRDNNMGYTAQVRFAEPALNIVPLAYDVYSTSFLLRRIG